MKKWIDFKALRARLDFERVLRLYGVEVKRKGHQHVGFCPLPNHNGKKNSPSFSANLERGIFQCFGCGAKGNVLEFAAMMEKTDPRDGAALHKVAAKLQQEFRLELDSTAAIEKPPVTETKQEPAKDDATVLVNAPLDFELKGLDPAHPYLASRAFSPETISRFGLGFCSRGMFKGRIVIPLHDHEGKLIGYAGRVVDDAAVNEENPRYRFPSSREREGQVFEFRKTAFLYNGSRIQGPVSDLIVVEGFTAVWWLTQGGLPNVVATMGADCSERQAELAVSLVKPDGRIWIIPDSDKAGERFAQSLLTHLAPNRFVRWIKLEADKQPTDYSAAFFAERQRV